MNRLATCVLLVSTTFALADEPKLDATEALAAAKQRGLKRTIILEQPIRCPAVATTTDVAGFRATGELAPFALAIDAFLRADFGVPEAVALLGDNVLCGQSRSTHQRFELAPRDPGIRAISLELYDGTLIGVVIDLEVPIAVDLAQLAKRLGPLRKIPGSSGASVAVIDIRTPTFHADLAFRADRRDATKLRSVIYRRTPMHEILSARFQTADDVARLVELAVHPRAPEPVRFYGTLGVFDKAHSTADDDVLLPAVDRRNVAKASITHVAHGRRRAVAKIEVTFATPITGDLAKALGVKPGKQLAVSGGMVTFDGTRLTIERR